MELLRTTDVLIEEDRQRDEMDEDSIAELAESILEMGLIHAPILEAEGSALKAGERRYRAIQFIHEQGKTYFYNGEEVPPGYIPVTRTHLLDEADLFELELEENIRREALTPAQRAAAIARLHKLRVTQVGAAQRGQKGGHTLEDTAKEVAALEGKTIAKHGSGMVSQALLIAEHMEDNAVRNAKSFSDAYKAASKKHTEAFRKVQSLLLDDEEAPDELKKLFELSPASGEGYSGQAEGADGKQGAVPNIDPRIGRMQIIQGNCMDVLAEMPADSFNGIITDPPYGVGANNFGSQVKQGHEYADDEESAFAIMDTIFKEGYRICKDEAHLFMFCDIRYFSRLADLAEQAGWWVAPKPLIWNKEGVGIAPYPKHAPRWTYEAILLASKGDRELLSLTNDVISVRPESGKEHAAQKPVELYRKLASMAFSSKDSILDPCAGSGTIFAMNPFLWNGYNRIVGIELSETFYHLCRDTINQVEENYK